MRRERFVLTFSEKKHYFLIFGVAVIFCCCQMIAAQSGRRSTNKSTVPARPPAASEPAADSPADVNANDKISSVVVLGQSSDEGYLFSRSNYLNIALKECVNSLKDYARQSGASLIVTKGDKMDFVQALERAKKETNTHLLWIDLALKDDAYGNTIIDYLDYALLAPQTAKRLASGRVQTGQTVIVPEGGILRLPQPPVARRSSPTLQIKSSAREIVNRLILRNWL